MTRDDLEAACWKALAAHGRTIAADPDDQALTDTADVILIDTILAAADQFATYTGGITAERRAVLGPSEGVRARRLAASAVHWHGHDGNAACRIPGKPDIAAAVGDVTCIACQRTHAYQRELALTGATA